MKESEVVAELRSENEQLRKENDTLLSVIAQMKITLNRLLDRYMIVTDR